MIESDSEADERYVDGGQALYGRNRRRTNILGKNARSRKNRSQNKRTESEQNDLLETQLLENKLIDWDGIEFDDDDIKSRFEIKY